MKNLLVLTDFSPNAKHAAEAALIIAQKLELNILLFNSYFSLPLVPSNKNDAWSKSYEIFKKESLENLEAEAKRLKELAGQPINRSFEPEINYLTEFGNLGDNIQNLIQQYEVESLVMGARDKQQSLLLFGEDINGVVRKSTKPIFIVHQTLNMDQIKNVVFATDLAESDLEAITYVNKLATLFGFKTNITHIAHPDRIGDQVQEQNTQQLKAGIEQLNAPGLSFHPIPGENVIHELTQFSNSIGAELLSIVRKKRSFIWRVFNESVSKEFVSESDFSILIIPEQ